MIGSCWDFLLFFRMMMKCLGVELFFVWLNIWSGILFMGMCFFDVVFIYIVRVVVCCILG